MISALSANAAELFFLQKQPGFHGAQLTNEDAKIVWAKPGAIVEHANTLEADRVELPDLVQSIKDNADLSPTEIYEGADVNPALLASGIHGIGGRADITDGHKQAAKIIKQAKLPVNQATYDSSQYMFGTADYEHLRTPETLEAVHMFRDLGINNNPLPGNFPAFFRLKDLLGIVPTAAQIAYGTGHMGDNDANLIEGAMTARLTTVLGAVPTAEQLAYGVANAADDNAHLTEGAMTARLTTVLGAVPTA
ncbi:MAG: hypothetical protein ACOH2E_05175, partial [Candidatus Paracaedibacter sp.]